MQAGARPGPGSRPRHLPPEPAHVQHPEALRRHWLRDTTPRWPRASPPLAPERPWEAAGRSTEVASAPRPHRLHPARRWTSPRRAA